MTFPFFFPSLVESIVLKIILTELRKLIRFRKLAFLLRNAVTDQAAEVGAETSLSGLYSNFSDALKNATSTSCSSAGKPDAGKPHCEAQ